MDNYIIKMELVGFKNIFNNLCEIEKQRRSVQKIYKRNIKRNKQ